MHSPTEVTSSRRTGQKSSRSALGGTALIIAASVVLWFATVHRAVFTNMGALGLVSILGWTYFVGLALIVVGFALELLRKPLRQPYLVALTILLIAYLFGSASAIEPTASLGDSWLHASFVHYIFVHGHSLNGYDARFSWPGFFSLAAVAVGFVGRTNAVVFLRWFPPFIELLYFAPLLAIAKSSDVDQRAAWLGVALFYATNWIYQDYFSPQAVNYLLYIVVIAAAMATWHSRGPVLATRAREGLTRRLLMTREAWRVHRLTGGDAVMNYGAMATLGVLFLLFLIGLASAVSHQLTPFAIIVELAVLVVSARLGRPELVIALGLVTLGWISLGASNFWIGHLSTIFGSAGDITSTINSNVASRVTGSASHLLVVDSRLLIVGALYTVATIGALRRSANSRSLELLAGAPFILIAAQSYGGEGLMRVVLFALPFTTLLAATAVFPRGGWLIHPWVPKFLQGQSGATLSRLAVVAVLGAFTLGNTLARGGNDAYESFSRGEVAATAYAYSHVSPGQVVGIVIYYLPADPNHLTDISTYTAAGNAIPSVQGVARRLVAARPQYVILSKSQEEWGEIVAGYPKGWEKMVAAYLLDHHFSVVAQWKTAVVLDNGTPGA